MTDKKKTKKKVELEQQLGELTADLQRTRADFENYRKRVESETSQAREIAKSSTILKLLPVIDNIERAIQHTPSDIADHQWVKGIEGLSKNLQKSLDGLGLRRIDSSAGVVFDTELHEAVQFEEGEGEQEIVAEELQSGYMLGDRVLRHAMVKVKKA
jgi:molecular chaperone GrpE